jgi:predicted DCC family thiol-disulfide oxidoreductase YuxK
MAHTPTPPAAVLFDGVCNLCNGAVRFIIRRDPRARFRFAALDSAAARSLLAAAPAAGSLPDSIILVEQLAAGSRVSTQSSAILRIARGLRLPWPLAYAFIVIPKPLRDALYAFIARHRYRWFGKRDSCMLPTPDLQSRFL